MLETWTSIPVISKPTENNGGAKTFWSVEVNFNIHIFLRDNLTQILYNYLGH